MNDLKRTMGSVLAARSESILFVEDGLKVLAIRPAALVTGMGRLVSFQQGNVTSRPRGTK